MTRRTQLPLALSIMIFLLASCTPRSINQQTTDKSAPQTSDEFKLIIPDDAGVKVLFSSIDARANTAGLSSLRKPLPKNDLETRLWIVAMEDVSGFALKRTSGKWSAVYLSGPHTRNAGKVFSLAAPEAGWENLWKKLTNQGILNLPQAHSIDCDGEALDGVDFVVENNIDNTYRTYWYDNPQLAKCAEAKQMIEIVDTFFEELKPPKD